MPNGPPDKFINTTQTLIFTKAKAGTHRQDLGRQMENRPAGGENTQRGQGMGVGIHQSTQSQGFVQGRVVLFLPKKHPKMSKTDFCLQPLHLYTHVHKHIHRHQQSFQRLFQMQIPLGGLHILFI